MNKSESIKNLTKAFAEFQGEVKNPPNSATNPQFRSKYAPLDVVINTVKPILEKHGLSFIQSTASQDENIIVTTLLMHESGEWIESDPLSLPAYQLKKGGEKDYNAQGAGSAITYGRRYSLSAMLGISSEDDDDGNVAVFNRSNSSSDSSASSNTDDERERKKQEALAKAKARKNENKEEEKVEDNLPFDPDEKDEEEVVSITDGQLKAIGNILNVVARKKKDFDSDSFLSVTLGGEFGKTSLEELTQEEAVKTLEILNKELKKK